MVFGMGKKDKIKTWKPSEVSTINSPVIAIVLEEHLGSQSSSPDEISKTTYKRTVMTSQGEIKSFLEFFNDLKTGETRAKILSKYSVGLVYGAKQQISFRGTASGAWLKDIAASAVQADYKPAKPGLAEFIENKLATVETSEGYIFF